MQEYLWTVAVMLTIPVTALSLNSVIAGSQRLLQRTPAVKKMMIRRLVQKIAEHEESNRELSPSESMLEVLSSHESRQYFLQEYEKHTQKQLESQDDSQDSLNRRRELLKESVQELQGHS